MSAQDIAARLQALEDIEAIRRLKARYLFACDRKDPAAMRACFANGAVDIFYDAIGRFETADALVKVYVDVGCHPHMVEMHHGANPQIEILDAERARGTWSLQYGLINTRENTLTQLAGWYEDGYRKIDGEWKMVKTHFFSTSLMVLKLDAEAIKVMTAGRPPAAA
ncbi:nuclear transport factor 2 family protein [Sinimarinibacterium thermocellulolyticum]|uniref:Nuclear transport factor 2 family protein n=1 Tax=Sinimarinibacterium thermocellulolyticum TaxID=3170016 RepID=A0ABV2ABZ8_9GAMM